MSNSARILLIVRNCDQRKLYHEFLVSLGYTVYLCDELANAFLQLIMFPRIEAVILDSDFPDAGLHHFLRTLANHAPWKKLPVLLVDTAEKGNYYQQLVRQRPFICMQAIDPQEIVRNLKQLLMDKEKHQCSDQGKGSKCHQRDSNIT